MEIWVFSLAGLGLGALISSLYWIVQRKKQDPIRCSITVDHTGEIIEASSAFNRFFGGKENATRTNFIFDFVHPQCKEKVGWDGDSIQKALLPKESFFIRLLDQNGDYKWIKAQGVTCKSKSESISFCYTFQVDLDWMGKLNDLESELWLKDYLLDQIPMNIYIKNTESQKIYINQAELNYSGFKSKEDVIGKSDWELYPKETAQISIEEDEVIFETQLPIEGEIKKNVRFEAPPTWFHTSKFPIRKNGEIIGLFGMSYDVTEIVNRDLEIEEKNKRLTIIQKELKSRIRELNAVNKSLKDSKSQAEELLLANNRFLSRFSHEVKTPLHSIKGFAYLLSQTELSSKQQQFLSFILNSSSSLNLLIDKVFNFSSFELGISKLNLEPVNLKSFCDEVFEHLIRLGEKKTQLHCFYDFDPLLDLQIEIDPLRLKLVIGHLFSNAVNFTKTGNVFFRVKLRKSDLGLKCFRIEIEDTGEGIPDELMEMIFDPFYHQVDQNENSTTEHGMGLAVCNSILKAMNSKLQVMSEVGKGSTFYFDLPLENR